MSIFSCNLRSDPEPKWHHFGDAIFPGRHPVITSARTFQLGLDLITILVIISHGNRSLTSYRLCMCRERFPLQWLNDPSMHRGTCVTAIWQEAHLARGQDTCRFFTPVDSHGWTTTLRHKCWKSCSINTLQTLAAQMFYLFRMTKCGSFHSRAHTIHLALLNAIFRIKIITIRAPVHGRQPMQTTLTFTSI